MQYPNDALTSSFQSLASTVNEFHLKGRPCLGATLKPKLRQLRIDETVLGFRKFRDFLRAAETAGYVSLAATPGGDIAISPGTYHSPPPVPLIVETPSVIPDPTPAQNMAGGLVRIRQDLWNAFNSFSGTWVYDSVRDLASKDIHGQRILDHGVISIPPGRERVTEWMRSFADMQDSEMKGQLNLFLSSNPGVYEFNQATRARGILREWSRFHVQNVLAAIEAWAASNKVRPANIAVPRSSPASSRVLISANIPPTVAIPPISEKPPQLETPDKPPTFVRPSSDALNSRLAFLVDALISDLISLRGLLQIIGPQS